MNDSWRAGSSGGAASVMEAGSTEVVDEPDASVEIASVTFAFRRARSLACRWRPEARPSGERPYARLASRCFSSSRDLAQGAHFAASEAHPTQKTLTSEHPEHRPNRPSTREPPSQGGWTPGAFDGTVIHGGRVVQDALATKARVARPEPSPTSSRAPYVVTALEGDEDAGGSSSKEFVRIPRNEARADTWRTSRTFTDEVRIAGGLSCACPARLPLRRPRLSLRRSPHHPRGRQRSRPRPSHPPRPRTPRRPTPRRKSPRPHLRRRPLNPRHHGAPARPRCQPAPRTPKLPSPSPLMRPDTSTDHADPDEPDPLHAKSALLGLSPPPMSPTLIPPPPPA